MANKNQKRIRVILRKDGEVAEMFPTHGYHNTDKGAFAPRRMSLVKYTFKKKAKPFPKSTPDNEMTMAAQRRIFHGGRSKI